MSVQFRSYATARSIYSFIGYVGWVMMGLGLVVFVVGSSISDPFLSEILQPASFVAGLIISMLGLFAVGASQAWRAGVDTAEFTQQILKTSRDQLRVSQQALKANVGGPASFSDVPDKDVSKGAPTSAWEQGDVKSASEMPPLITEFHGQEIVFENGQYRIAEKEFATLSKARDFILASENTAKLQG